MVQCMEGFALRGRKRRPRTAVEEQHSFTASGKLWTTISKRNGGAVADRFCTAMEPCIGY